MDMIIYNWELKIKDLELKYHSVSRDENHYQSLAPSLTLICFMRALESNKITLLDSSMPSEYAKSK